MLIKGDFPILPSQGRLKSDSGSEGGKLKLHLWKLSNSPLVIPLDLLYRKSLHLHHCNHKHTHKKDYNAVLVTHFRFIFLQLKFLHRLQVGFMLCLFLFSFKQVMLGKWATSLVQALFSLTLLHSEFYPFWVQRASLTLLLSEWPKLHRVLAILSAKGLIGHFQTVLLVALVSLFSQNWVIVTHFHKKSLYAKSHWDDFFSNFALREGVSHGIFKPHLLSLSHSIKFYVLSIQEWKTYAIHDIQFCLL